MGVSPMLFMADLSYLMVFLLSFNWNLFRFLNFDLMDVHCFAGLPPLVLRRILEILTYLANNHSAVASLLFFFDSSLVPESLSIKTSEAKKDKGKEKMLEGDDLPNSLACSGKGDIPLILFLKLLRQPLFLRSIAHLEQVCSRFL